MAARAAAVQRVPLENGIESIGVNRSDTDGTRGLLGAAKAMEKPLG